MSRIITLTTDFGLSDGFVGTMKGVILGINPQATIVDITHDIAPQNIEQGAFLFANAAPYFPANTIHVVVVDPGVGSARRPIAINVGETFFIAPDNGVVSLATLVPPAGVGVRNSQSVIRAIHLNRPEFWLPRVSHTFHGRDIFAPVAAHLSLGASFDALGDPIDDWVQLPLIQPALLTGNVVVGRVIHIDHFGNILTTIGAESLSGIDHSRLIVRMGERTVHGIRSAYASVERGAVLALFSSSGNLEIAVRDGTAAQTLGVRIGDEVSVSY